MKKEREMQIYKLCNKLNISEDDFGELPFKIKKLESDKNSSSSLKDELSDLKKLNELVENDFLEKVKQSKNEQVRSEFEKRESLLNQIIDQMIDYQCYDVNVLEDKLSDLEKRIINSLNREAIDRFKDEKEDVNNILENIYKLKNINANLLTALQNKCTKPTEHLKEEIKPKQKEENQSNVLTGLHKKIDNEKAIGNVVPSGVNPKTNNQDESKAPSGLHKEIDNEKAIVNAVSSASGENIKTKNQEFTQESIVDPSKLNDNKNAELKNENVIEKHNQIIVKPVSSEENVNSNRLSNVPSTTLLIKDPKFVKESDFAKELIKQIEENLLCQKRSSHHRAVIVFFESKEALLKSKKELADLNFHIHVFDISDSDSEALNKLILKNTKTTGSVTFLIKDYVNGFDFKNDSYLVNKNGGVHIIQTFYSNEIRNEILRNGEKGSYNMAIPVPTIILEDLLGSKKDLDSLSSSETENLLKELEKGRSDRDFKRFNKNRNTAENEANEHSTPPLASISRNEFEYRTLITIHKDDTRFNDILDKIYCAQSVLQASNEKLSLKVMFGIYIVDSNNVKLIQMVTEMFNASERRSIREIEYFPYCQKIINEKRPNLIIQTRLKSSGMDKEPDSVKVESHKEFPLETELNRFSSLGVDIVDFSYFDNSQIVVDFIAQEILKNIQSKFNLNKDICAEYKKIKNLG